jgi:transposase
MRDTEFYRQILGLEAPWTVSEVKLDIEAGQVDVWVDHAKGLLWPCPECARELSCRDHAEERVWRHLDTCQFKTLLHARIPRVDCPDHGVGQVTVPWAEPRSRFTLLFERLAIDVLTHSATVSSACRLLGLSWDEAWGIQERAVARGLERKQAQPTPFVGVDEKAFRKGHQYVTVVSDTLHGTVEYVADGRTTESLQGYWESLTEAQLAAVGSVTMDMWTPYINATLAGLPDADQKIVFDRFHIMRHMVEAVDKVRREEHRELLERGDETLKHSRWLWLYNRENVPARAARKLASLARSTLKVARAWAIKEALRPLWEYRSVGWARRYFDRWYGWAIRSRLEPVKQVARMLKRHLVNVLSYCRLWVTNATAEGLNAKITAIKNRACGYRNREHFRIAIYFHCGGLDLYPR